VAFVHDQPLMRQSYTSLAEKSPFLVITGATKWSRVRLYCARIIAAVDSAAPATYTEVEIPFGQTG